MDFIFSYIEKMQNESQEVRKKFAMTVAVIITILILFFWLSANFFGSLSHKDEKTSEADLTPLEGMGGAISSLYHDLKNISSSFSDFKNNPENK